MGAALFPIDPNRPDADTGKHERATSPFERSGELNLPRALSMISEVEAELAVSRSEVQALRLALARIEHKVVCHEQLLRNAFRREQELRAQLADILT